MLQTDVGKPDPLAKAQSVLALAGAYRNLLPAPGSNQVQIVACRAAQPLLVSCARPEHLQTRARHRKGKGIAIQIARGPESIEHPLPSLAIDSQIMNQGLQQGGTSAAVRCPALLQQGHAPAEVKAQFPSRRIDAQLNTCQQRRQMRLRHELTIHIVLQPGKGLAEVFRAVLIGIGGRAALTESRTHKGLHGGHDAGVNIAAPAVRGKACRSGPGVDKLFQNGLPSRHIRLRGKALHQGFQGTAPIPGHGLMQTVHVAKGHNIRQGRYLFGNLDQLGGQSARRIFGKPHVGHLARAAVYISKTALLPQRIAVGIHHLLHRVAGTETLDAQLVQGQQLALADFAVAVFVPPDPQGSKGRVTGIQHAVFVFIQLSQGRKAVGGLLAIFQQAVVAKEFRTIVYLSVAVPVPDQETVIRRHPAGKLGKAVAVVVEEHTRILAQGLDAITVQIENNGILTGCAEEPFQPIQQAVHKGIVRTLLRRVFQVGNVRVVIRIVRRFF